MFEASGQISGEDYGLCVDSHEANLMEVSLGLHTLEFSLNYTKSATLSTKTYKGKNEINSAKNCLQWG